MSTIAVIIDDMFEDAEYSQPAPAFTEAGHELVHVGLEAGKTVKGTMWVKTTDRDEPEVEIKYGVYPADRIRSMKDRIRKPERPKPTPSSSAR